MDAKTDADVKCEKVAVPRMLRGDAKLVAEVLASEVAANDDRAARGVMPLDARKRQERLRLLTIIFAALGGGKDAHAATIYGAMSEGF